MVALMLCTITYFDKCALQHFLLSQKEDLWQSWVHKRFGKAGCCAEELYVHRYYYGKHAQVLQHNLSHLLKTMLANGLETCILTNEKYRPQGSSSFIGRAVAFQG